MDDDTIIYFDYSFRSSPVTNDMSDPDYFIKDIRVNIFQEADLDDDDTENLLIGKVRFKVIYVDQAMEAGAYLSDVFDCYEYSFRHGQEIIDFSTGAIRDDIQEFFDYEILNSNICILEEISVLPEFRGHKVAAEVVRDIIFNYNSVCSLFVIQPFPMQFKNDNNERDEWIKQLCLDSFSKDKEMAFQRLRGYYTNNLGFHPIPGHENLLFYCTSFVNESFGF